MSEVEVKTGDKVSEYYRIQKNPEYLEALRKVYEAHETVADAQRELASVIERLKEKGR